MSTGDAEYDHAVVVAEQLRQPDFDLAESIAWIREHIEQSKIRLRVLEKHLESPRVLVVLHYKHYRDPMTSDFSEGETLERAYHQLWHLTYDNSTGAPIGIEVGGCMVTWDELVAEFGEYNPW